MSIKAYDNINLVAEQWLSNEKTEKWVILVHSYRMDYIFMYLYEEYYHSKSYNILVPDNRAHGFSNGELIGMGNLDLYDINYWIDYICNINKDVKIILTGVSMGAAAVITAAASSEA